jgi:hypothetical protein
MLLALLFLHLAGALKHQFFDREPELQRMGVGRSKPDEDNSNCSFPVRVDS